MKQIRGEVVSDKMLKSATVRVDRLWRHPLYKKGVKRSKKYLTDNSIGAKTGDKVLILSCRPLSKRKMWKIVKILK